MTKTLKRNIVLPTYFAEEMSKMNTEERDATIRALRKVGWTYESIGQPLSISRERVRQICASSEVEDSYVPVPLPPVKQPKARRSYTEPKPEVLARLLELQPKAQQVRSNSPRYRHEAEEYTLLLHKANAEDGVSIYRLAKRLGITHSSIRFRLARYGYRPNTSGVDNPVYRPLKNRVSIS